MAFDIHGNDLRPGHCEVHPHIHESYPCFLCLQENKDNRQEEDDRNARWEKEYDLHCAEQIAQHRVSIGAKP